jgi:selenocysteine lyase/cysteine desulfurase
MDHGAEHLLDSLVGLPVDLTEHLIDALHTVSFELGNLNHDDVVKLLGTAITASAGAATKHYLNQHRQELEMAIRQSLATQ